MFVSFRLDLRKKAQELRNNMTISEKKIWHEVLSRKQLQYRFLRQKPIGNYIVDFYCSTVQLVIEIDGDSHAFQEEYDQERTEYLQKQKIVVVRYTNSDVMTNLSGVYDDLICKIQQREKELSISKRQ